MTDDGLDMEAIVMARLPHPKEQNYVMILLLAFLCLSVAALLFIDFDKGMMHFPVFGGPSIEDSSVEVRHSPTGQAIAEHTSLGDMPVKEKALAIAAVWLVLFVSAVIFIKIVAERA